MAEFNLSKVKSITIPEGSVKSIAIGEMTVWQKEDSLYNELSYLVAVDSSKAWIDTGIPYQNGCKVEIKTTLYGNSNLFGVFYTTERCRGYWNTNGTAIFNIGRDANDTLYSQITGFSINDTVIWTCTANPDTKEVSLIIGDKSDIKTAQSDTIVLDTSPNTIYLFAVNRTNTDTAVQGTRIIHYFKYWNVDNDLVLDLVPVERKSDGVLGMFNKVNGQFLTNISTGTFYKQIPANTTSDEAVDDMEFI